MLISIWKNILRWALFVALLLVMVVSRAQKSTTRYQWHSVPISGGGFVSGIVFHPTSPGVRYCRTDMGGAYRWNDTYRAWEPLLDWLSYEDRNLMGVESIALDPANPDFLLLACGTYTHSKAPNGAILRSFDRGKTFERVDMPFKFGGNENGRGNGERMAVDPVHPETVYLGTRYNGLWRSNDKGATWNRVNSFPDVSEEVPDHLDSLQRRRWVAQNGGSGIVFTLFKPGRAVKEPSIIYVGVSLKDRDNLFQSMDGGKSWSPVPRHPRQYRPTHAVLSADGFLFLTYGDTPGPSMMNNGGVWKFNTTTGEWTDITPDQPDRAKGRTFGYAAIAVDAQNPMHVIASTYHRYSAGGEEIFRSTDGGKSWKPVLVAGSTFDNREATYVGRTGVHWLFDIELDPFDPNHALFTTGYGGHETYNLNAIDKGRRVEWTVLSNGIEETVALELLSPSQGAPLITAIGDYGGFVHWDLEHPAAEGNFYNPHFGNTNGLACAEKKPDLIVRVGVSSRDTAGSNIGFSVDGGRNWQPTLRMPNAGSRLGHIAVSAEGESWIWAPYRSDVYRSADSGHSWQKVQGLPAGIRVIADKVNSKKFYALSLSDGYFYNSNDGGKTFSLQKLPPLIKRPLPGAERGDVRGGQDRIYATPGREGELWLAAYDGLYRTKNGGKTFYKMAEVSEIHAFGFGKNAPSSSYPALYLVGVVDGKRGIFRSDDTAHSWTRINDEAHQWGLVLHITGDPKKYGRVYVGTHGRGILYGDPQQD